MVDLDAPFRAPLQERRNGQGTGEGDGGHRRGIPPEEGGRASAFEQKQDEEREQNIPEEEKTGHQTGFTGVSRGLLQRISINVGLIMLVVGIAGLIVVGVLLRRLLQAPRPGQKVHMRRHVPHDFVERVWERLLKWGEHLGVSERPSLTPMEQAAIFAENIPGIADDVHDLARLYARDQYSPHPLQQEEMQQAQFTWLKLRSQLIRAWLNRRFHFIQQIGFWR